MTAVLAACRQPHQVRFALRETRNHHGRKLLALPSASWQALPNGARCFGPDAVRIRARSTTFRTNLDLIHEERDPHGWLRLLKEHVDDWPRKTADPDARVAAELRWMVKMFEQYGTVAITAQARSLKGLTPSHKLVEHKEPDPGQGGFW